MNNDSSEEESSVFDESLKILDLGIYKVSIFKGDIDDLFIMNNLLLATMPLPHSALNTRTFLKGIERKLKFLEIKLEKNNIRSEWVDITFKDLGKKTTIIFKTMLKLKPYIYTYNR
jgi:hypothetical protein